MDTKPTDEHAWEAHASGMTWAEVARKMHYANGSVARRAAMRHASRLGLSEAPQATPERSAEPEPTQALIDEPTDEAEEPETNALSDLKEGDLVYHHFMPRAKYKFVKWNADGSAQVWGGEVGHPAYRDWHVDKLSRVPNNDIESILQYASRNVFVETSVDCLTLHLGVSRANARKAISERPDIFRRLAFARYEIRDPQADRTADKVGVS